MIRKLTSAALAAVLTTAGLWLATPTSEAQGNVEVLEGTFTKKKKLKRKKIYLLRGGVFIKKKLIVQPGTQIFGLPGSFLVIDKGAKIQAIGTREDPIVFTSSAPAGQRRRGDWGGLIINGNAPINVPGGTAVGEGDTGSYGGNKPAESSGIMRFVRVEYGGFAISPENELNAIAFQGVGSGTTVEFVQSAWGGDDGFEWFGGTVNAKNIVVTGAGDDSLDWTFGWTGKVQFAVVQQRADEADTGIEADNNENGFELTPRSAPRMANVTLVGAPDAGPGSKRGMLLRRGTAGEFRNFIITGFKDVGLELNGESTLAQVNSDALTLRGFIFFNNGQVASPANSNFVGNTATALGNKGQKIAQADPLLTDPFDTTRPDFRPQAGSPALDPANVEPVFNDPFFTQADFVGAFDGNDDWTLGWTVWVFRD